MKLELIFFIFFLSISTFVSPSPLKIKENNLQLKTQKGKELFGTKDELSLDRKKRYSPFYSKAYSHFNILLSDINSITTSPPTTNKSNELGNNEKYNCLFNQFNWILHRKKRYSSYYKRNCFHLNVPLIDKISTATTPLPTTKLNDQGNVST